MEHTDLDKRFCLEALDALKTFGYVEFTLSFIKENKIKTGNTLQKMWQNIDTWLSKGSDKNCCKLLEYVDTLKMWGKQRIFLFRIENKKDIIEKLSNDDELQATFGEVYNHPKYVWEVDNPTLVHVKKQKDKTTNDSLLILKFVELRKFNITKNKILSTLEERSTNFFIINLSSMHAELRLQQLPTNALINLKQEYFLFIKAIQKYIVNFHQYFKPISLYKPMHKMVSQPIFRITRTVFVSRNEKSKTAPIFLAIINIMFKYPVVSYISAYWECEQKTIGKSKLYFSLYGTNNSIDIGGIEDPDKISELLQTIMHIEGEKPGPPTLFKHGLIHKPYIALTGHPKEQAFLLSAGIIAAWILWIILEASGNFALDELIQSLLGKIPSFILKTIIEIIWIIIYYGWDRTLGSFKALLKLRPRQLHDTFRYAKNNTPNLNARSGKKTLTHYKN